MAIKERVRYNAKTDEYIIGFYEGRKKASPEAVKQYIKEHFNDIKPERLPEDYRRYYSSVKGGRARSAKAIRIDGKFVNDEFSKYSGLDTLAKYKGYKSVKEMLSKDAKVRQAAEDMYNSDKGLKYKYNGTNILGVIDSFTGKVFVNGRELTKMQAVKRIDDYDKILKRKFKSVLNEFWVYYKKGGSEMHFDLPPLSKLEKMTPDELIEEIENAENETLEVIESEPKKKSRTKEKPHKDFIYNFVILWKKRKKRGDIPAQNKEHATNKLKQMYPGCVVISLKRHD